MINQRIFQDRKSFSCKRSKCHYGGIFPVGSVTLMVYRDWNGTFFPLVTFNLTFDYKLATGYGSRHEFALMTMPVIKVAREAIENETPRNPDDLQPLESSVLQAFAESGAFARRHIRILLASNFLFFPGADPRPQ